MIMDIRICLFSISVVILLEGLVLYFLLRRHFKSELEKIQIITSNLYEQSKLFGKIKVLESQKDIAINNQNLNSYDYIRKEQKRTDAELRRKLKNSNDIRII